VVFCCFLLDFGTVKTVWYVLFFTLLGIPISRTIGKAK